MFHFYKAVSEVLLCTLPEYIHHFLPRHHHHHHDSVMNIKPHLLTVSDLLLLSAGGKCEVLYLHRVDLQHDPSCFLLQQVVRLYCW